MPDRSRRTAALAVVAAFLVACGGSAVTPPAAPTDAPVAPPSAVASEPGPSESRDPSPASSAPTASGPVIDAAWARTELTDVATGETFRVADLAGRVVIVETMAIWCTSCLAQQGEVYAALGQLHPERVAYVLLDVDPNETGPALATYRERNGFTGTYAVADLETARALAADFGDQVLNPPSTPMIVIGTDGRITLTDFGRKPATAVVQLARDHGA